MNVIQFYVPSTDNTQKPDVALLAGRTREVASKLAALAGGATAIPASGFWHSDTLGLIEENVSIVQTFSNADIFDAVQALADRYVVEWDQEAVLFVYNGVPHGI